MVDIAFSSTAPRLGGTTEADDWQAERVNAPRSVTVEIPPVDGPDFVALGGTETLTYHEEFDLVLTGQTSGVTVESLTPKMRFVGNHAEQVDGGGTNLPYRVRGPWHYRDYEVPQMYGVRSGSTSRSSVIPKPGTPLAASDAILRNMIDGKSPGAATQDAWSSATYAGTYAAVANPTNAFASLMPELSCVMFASSRHGRGFPAVLLGPRVAMAAWHVGHRAGDTLTWRRTDGSFQSVTISEAHNIQTSGTSVDCALLLLSAAVTGVTFARCLPADALDYYPGLDTARGSLGDHRNNGRVVVLGWTRNTGKDPGTDYGTNIISTDRPHLRLALMRRLHNSQGMGTEVNANVMSIVWDAVPADDPIRPWSMCPYSGDSSSPFFLPTPNGLALICCLFGSNGGPSVAHMAPAISAKAIERGFAPAGWSIGTVPMTGLTKPT